jgi:hypothetical protein
MAPNIRPTLNCDSTRNFDGPVGGNADGFSAKWSLGPGNVFSGCRSWENFDDGWGLWMGSQPVLITNCWAFRNAAMFGIPVLLRATATDSNWGGGQQYCDRSSPGARCVFQQRRKRGQWHRSKQQHLRPDRGPKRVLGQLEGELQLKSRCQHQRSRCAQQHLPCRRQR